MKQTLKSLVGTIVTVAAVTAFTASAGATGKDAPPPPARNTLLTLDYVNAEVTDVIRALATQSGANVAVNPSVKGQVTVHLREKTMDEALTMVTNLAGLGAKKVQGTYVIAPKSEMRQTLDRLGESRRIALSYITDKVAADLVQNAFSDVTARPFGKEVAINGAPEDLDGAEKLIKQNDVFSAGTVRTTMKVEVKNRPADKLALSIAKMSPGVTVESAGTAVVLTGQRTEVETAKANVELLDVPGQPATESRLYRIRYVSPLQLVHMMLQAAKEVEVIPGPDSFAPSRPIFNPLSGQFIGGASGSSGGQSGNGSGQQQGAAGQQADPNAAGAGGAAGPAGALGMFKNARTLLLKGSPAALDEAIKMLRMVDTAPRQMVIEAKVVDTSPEYTKNLGVEWNWNQFQFFERGQTTTTAAGPLGFGSYLRAPFNPIATLNAMVTNKQAKLLANPSTSVIDDQDASVFIGDTLRFQSLAQSSPTTGNQFTVVEVPVGIILLVHPRVNDNGYITLRVHPVVSTVTGFTAGLPQTSSREAETVVRVKDGDTLVIAGLIRDEDIRQMSKIPFLGDLPIIGNLFKNETRNHRRSEVMIFLTIKLIPQAND